ncbi:hypothetical protein ACFVRB_00770 [Streptomyces nojiriensis]
MAGHGVDAGVGAFDDASAGRDFAGRFTCFVTDFFVGPPREGASA